MDFYKSIKDKLIAAGLTETSALHIMLILREKGTSIQENGAEYPQGDSAFKRAILKVGCNSTALLALLDTF